MAASWSSGTYGRRLPVRAWLSGSRAAAAIASPSPSPIVMIRPASQRAIDRTWPRVPPTSRRSPSSRPRCSAIIVRVLITAIEVNAKMITTNSGPSQRLVSRSASVAVLSEARSFTRSPGYRAASACRRWATAAGLAVCTRIVPSSGVVWCPAASSGASSASPNASARV